MTVDAAYIHPYIFKLDKIAQLPLYHRKVKVYEVILCGKKMYRKEH